MNLPNALTVGRIVAAPLIAVLPFAAAWEIRLLGFVLYLAAGLSDYYDGVLARSHNLVTDLGKLLDPLADKLLLVATLVPMYLLMSGRGTPVRLAFVTPLGPVGVPLWVLVVVIGRELLMTVFRQAAAARGVIIAAIGPAKWKTGFQATWVGAAYFWFAASAAAARYDWTGSVWHAFALFNGLVGLVTMSVAVVLTIYSLWLYLRRYAAILMTRKDASA